MVCNNLSKEYNIIYIYAYIGTVQCNVYMYANRSEEWWL